MINYPLGHRPRSNSHPQSQHQTTYYGSRGMSLEEMINASNQYYLQHQIAVIHKKPTPIQIVNVSYPRRSAAKITEAYFRQASTTDYNGIYQGYYIDFEAKETKNKTRFPLDNLKAHQLEHMAQCYQQGGIVFLLISFVSYGEVYLLPYPTLKTLIQDSKRKSLSYKIIQEKAYLCPVGVFPLIDYLKTVDSYIQSESKNRKGSY